MQTAIVLINPKYPHNVGGALRASAAFGASHLLWTGERVTLEGGKGNRLPREERMRGYRAEVAFGPHSDPFAHLTGFTPVAVEVRGDFESLPFFDHPPKAVYFFGPEDGSLPKSVIGRCHRFLYVPAHYALNLAACVNIVLYDRLAKQHRQGPVPTLRDLLMPDLAEPMLKGLQGR